MKGLLFKLKVLFVYITFSILVFGFLVAILGIVLSQLSVTEISYNYLSTKLSIAAATNPIEIMQVVSCSSPVWTIVGTVSLLVAMKYKAIKDNS